MMPLMMIGIALLAGGCIGLSRVMNAQVSRELGSFGGSLLNHIVGFVFLVLLLGATSWHFQLLPNSSSSPHLIYYMGGILGLFFVGLVNTSIPQIGVTQTVVLVTSGQMLGSFFLDLTLDPEIHITKKLAGVALIILGVVLSSRSSDSK